jgi:ATPases with chaperone activity, ATP-binding subunit
MATLTKAARMAWEIGAAEAAELRHPFIEREHLLIGLCSLGKILQYLDYTRVESLPVDILREEADGIGRVLAPLGITDASMRRGVRSRLRPGNAVHTERAVHRSPECKRYFRRAAEIVKDGGEVAVRHLFAAVLEDPGPVVSAVLAGAGISPGVLREKLLDGRELEQEPIPVREARKPGVRPSPRSRFPPRPRSWTASAVTSPGPLGRGASCRSSTPTGPATLSASSSRS